MRQRRCYFRHRHEPKNILALFPKLADNSLGLLSFERNTENLRNTRQPLDGLCGPRAYHNRSKNYRSRYYTTNSEWDGYDRFATMLMRISGSRRRRVIYIVEN